VFLALARAQARNERAGPASAAQHHAPDGMNMRSARAGLNLQANGLRLKNLARSARPERQKV